MRRERRVAQRPRARLKQHLAAGHLHAFRADPAAQLAAALVHGDFAVAELLARKVRAREARNAPAEHCNPFRLAGPCRREAQPACVVAALRRQQRPHGARPQRRREVRYMSPDKHCRWSRAVADVVGGSMAAICRRHGRVKSRAHAVRASALRTRPVIALPYIRHRPHHTCTSCSSIYSHTPQIHTLHKLHKLHSHLAPSKAID